MVRMRCEMGVCEVEVGCEGGGVVPRLQRHIDAFKSLEHVRY